MFWRKKESHERRPSPKKKRSASTLVAEYPAGPLSSSDRGVGLDDLKQRMDATKATVLELEDAKHAVEREIARVEAERTRLLNKSEDLARDLATARDSFATLFERYCDAKLAVPAVSTPDSHQGGTKFRPSARSSSSGPVPPSVNSSAFYHGHGYAGSKPFNSASMGPAPSGPPPQESRERTVMTKYYSPAQHTTVTVSGSVRDLESDSVTWYRNLVSGTGSGRGRLSSDSVLSVLTNLSGSEVASNTALMRGSDVTGHGSVTRGGTRVSDAESVQVTVKTHDGKTVHRLTPTDIRVGDLLEVLSPATDATDLHFELTTLDGHALDPELPLGMAFAALNPPGSSYRSNELALLLKKVLHGKRELLLPNELQ